MGIADRVRTRGQKSERDNDEGVEQAQVRGRERRGLRASAARLQLDNRKMLRSQTVRRQEWQDEAWDYFDDIGEIKYTARLAGNVMSKLRFYVAVAPLDNPEGDPIAASDAGSGIPPALAARAEAELERLKSPFGGRAEIVRMLYMNLEVAAECYLVGLGPRVTYEDTPTGRVEVMTDESWEIKSVDEVDASGERVKVIRFPGDTQGIELKPEYGDAIIRIWERHPRWSYLPDNAMRGVLGICEALVLLENQVKATAKSHASAGFFTLPNELDKLTDETTPPEGDGQDTEDGPSFLEQFNETLMEPIENPSSAAAVAPMPITGPAEFLTPEYVRHIPLHRESDPQLDARIEGRVLRLARGLNYPVETVLGHQQTTFANAAVIDEDKFKDHYEPRAILMCDAWTVGFLQPNLIDSGENPDLVNRLFVWFDAAALLRGVEPHETADRGWDIGAISDVAWRRVNGWTEDDAPDPVERLLRSVMRLRSLDPGLSTAILELLGVPLNIPSAVPAGPGPVEDPAVPAPPDGDAPTPPTESIEPRSLAEALLLFLAARRRGEEPSRSVIAKVSASATPAAVRAARRADAGARVGRQLMDVDRELRTRLTVASHNAMLRAMEKAGNRLKGSAPTAMAKNPKLRGQGQREMIRSVHPRYAAAVLGPKLVADAGFTESDLIGADAWDALEQQYRTWVAEAQAKAMAIVGRVVPLSTDRRASLAFKQETALNESWEWLRDELQALAEKRLYGPDPLDPMRGEFDPTASVPVGMLRQAIARAGGATGLQPPAKVIRAASATDTFVVLNNGNPPGGIGTGELMDATLAEGGASTEAYMWDYGPAFRKSPFEDHEALDGIVFDSFESEELDASSSWVDSDNFYPGDHDGCCCDVVPIIVGPGDVAFNEASGEAFYTDQGASEDVTAADDSEGSTIEPVAPAQPKGTKR